MKPTGLKEYIEEYLKKHGKQPGGNIERDVATTTMYKPGTINRTLRLMENEGTIVKSFTRIFTGPKFVEYKWVGKKVKQLTF